MDRLRARHPSRALRIAVSALAAAAILGSATGVGAISPTPSSAAPRILATGASAASDDRGAVVDAGAMDAVAVNESPSILAPEAQPAVAPVQRPQRAAELVTQKVATKRTAAPRPVVYAGANHLWIPSLGVNRSVYSYACTRSTPLDNLVYRWGCAGRNNVYLMGHAWGVFKPLADAYQGGRLRIGMEAIYADASGHIRRYRVVAWRVVLPTDTSWIGAMSQPTMILQTCYGATSTYRLNIKLVAES